MNQPSQQNTSHVLVLTLRPEPEGEDRFGRGPEVRLRLLLKSVLRMFGFRCVSIDRTPAPGPAHPPENPR